ncbi:MAG: hypothetical protein RL235_450 [Chlamydiota bacterium]|jgi:hypothetical protein
MNLLNKTTPWVVASLLVATSAFGQSKCPPAQKSFEQGNELSANQMMAAYNAPARIDVRGAWDFYASASFIYWQPSQDNMMIAVTNSSQAVPAAGTISPIDGNVINQNFKFKPGFKVGLGMNFDHDNWDVFTEYTWFHAGSMSNSSNAKVNGSLFASRAHPNTNSTNIFTSASGSWKVNMDFLDMELARASYVGTSLTFRPFFGARAAWIRQRAVSTYTNASITTGTAVRGTLQVTENVRSWGIGPRAGLYTNWLLGQGFRFYGNGFLDLLYTHYGKANHFSNWTVLNASTSTGAHIRGGGDSNTNGIRTHIDLEFGFGWGTYFDNSNWHVDLLLGYGFQVFFDQNQFRHFESVTAPGVHTEPNGNMYIQGLTTTLRFDF